MKILVIGGTGPIGGHAALHLKEQGHDVTLAARKPAADTTALAKLPFLQGDYIEGFNKADLAKFEGMVFAAGQDPRHLGKGDDGVAWWEKANIQGVPRLFAAARDAGVQRAVNVGSFYPQVRPALIDSNPYIKSRHLSDVAIRALATPNFHAVSVNAPYVMGTVPGLMVPYLNLYTQYAQGKKPKVPVFAPTGGVNFISTLSLAEAIAGALLKGKNATPYLVGDQNLSFRDFFQMFFDAAGNTVTLEEKHEEHPYIGNYAGLGQTLYFEPDAAETALLGYRRNDMKRVIEDTVAQYRS